MSANTRTHRLCLPPQGYIALNDRFLGEQTARETQETLLSELDWEQHTIQLFGKRVLQPRLICWAGTKPYTYSGLTLPPRLASATLSELFEQVSKQAGTRFNHVLVNRYRNGFDGMGWHSDDEPELGPSPTVAALSFGVTRRFLIRAKKRSETKVTHEFALGHGSLLVMTGDLQHHYRHSVPKQAHVVGERLSLTFREIRF